MNRNRLNRLAKRIFMAKDGSVSILLVFIVAAMFLFIAVFIDYARIAAAEWRIEALARAGIRSVMSAYEPALQERYQLFAYGATDPAQILDYVMQDQNRLRSAGVFPWVPLLLDSHTTSVTRPLADYDEMERQIGEEMKYKAPVQFVFELSGKLKPISGALKEAAQTTELLAKLQKLVDRRDKELLAVLKLQKKSRDALDRSGIGKGIAANRNDMMEDRLVGSIRSAADIAAQYADYAEKKRDDDRRGDDEDPQHRDDTARYEKDSREHAWRLRRAVTLHNGNHERWLREARPHLKEARDFNEEMKRVIEEVRSSPDYAGYDKVGQSAIPDGGTMDNGKQIEDAIKEINASAEQLVMPDSFFEEWSGEIDRQQAVMSRIDNAASVFHHLADSISAYSTSAYTLKNKARELLETYETYATEFIRSAGSYIERREAAMIDHQGKDKKRKQVEQEADKELEKAKGLLSSLSELKSKLQEHQAAFDEVRGKMEAIDAYNQSSTETPAERTVVGDAVEESRQSMDSVTALYDQAADGLLSLRDRLYRNEYAYMYFTSYDPRQLKSLLDSMDAGEEVVKTLGIANQELEYILYGFHNPVGNIAAAYGEIFTMRLAIRTMEGFVEFGKLGHPLLILASAILYGIQQAVQDMLLLVTKNEIPISRYLPAVKLNYAGHLRLFMLAHGGREGMLKRMLALIHYHTGIDPAARGTYGETEVRLSTPLWFLPGLMKLLGYAGLWDGEIENGRYYAVKRSVFSY
ncbi:acyl-CoA cholesterol acyltransferase [Paenibacillus melissococcoides]|uniref:Acyl-CoA cholesterol acyltransferase n=1 Tax=Paenibacillus melissococcoides TaxID=2912268 RepID=A0ABN8U3U4_9BACL|nr:MULTISPECIES: acyl-CoA cholesterol acyltransferase [Paenibacillus]MEB9895136.1 acyl-CoA cholesterol acyltransferase [Bacillus cereus]CAH8245724.1 acyl-CoA cholesterol acyltransferase [Paenibacillus melissococcoides]CAH8711895.1 acyl-CoA cholesterol acyltransferase [Paenibacillus melissococcoides]CAH8712641.1 acyl-CoA cholesterol acyltransferase [Paenibacillus melissococcoides]